MSRRSPDITLPWPRRAAGVALCAALLATGLLAAPARGAGPAAPLAARYLDAAAPTSIATPATPAPAGTPAPISSDIRFGAVEAYQAPTRATQAGVRWERLPFVWSAIQPRSALDWQDPYTTRFLTDEASRGRAVAGVIVGTPPWAAIHPAQGAAAVPGGLSAPAADAANTWGAFVARLVQRYRGLVKTWIIWNEPDRGATWAGGPADYYLLLKTAYLAAKAADPQCQVIVGGLTYWADHDANRPQFLDTLLTQAAADPTGGQNNGYFDGVALHVHNNPLDSYTVPLLFTRIVAAHGFRGKAVWIDETGVAPYDDPAGTAPRLPFRTTLDGQASYVVQSYALALAAGLRRIGVYRMVDSPADAPDHDGLVRQDGSLRPAFAAYQTVTSVFGGTTSAYYTWHDDGSAPSAAEVDALLASNATGAQFVWPAAVNRVVLRQGDRQVTVVWDASPASAQVSLPVSGHDAVLVDKTGARTPLAPGADGFYHLTLQGSTDNSDPRDPQLYLVGGSPLIVQESGVTASATPPPAPTPAVTATVTAVTNLSATATPAVTAPVTSTATSLSRGARGPAVAVSPLPTSARALYFPQSGHNVAGAFRAVFTQYGGVATFGYPRTESIREGGQLVQYFQNAALSCTRQCRDPAYTATVSVAPLGETIVTGQSPFPQAPRLTTWADSMYFAATEHNLSGPFLDYWRANNGDVLLGVPLSEPLDEVEASGTAQPYTLQYFQRGALAYRPSGPLHAFAVVPVPLGDELLRQRGWLP